MSRSKDHRQRFRDFGDTTVPKHRVARPVLGGKIRRIRRRRQRKQDEGKGGTGLKPARWFIDAESKAGSDLFAVQCSCTLAVPDLLLIHFDSR